MEGNITFYTYGTTMELNGQMFSAGELTVDLLNMSPEVYRPIHERMEKVCKLSRSYEETRDYGLWWELNNELEEVCHSLRQYMVFRSLLGDSEDDLFRVTREITQQYSLLPPPEEKKLSEGDFQECMEIGRELLKLNELDDPPEPDPLSMPFGLFDAGIQKGVDVYGIYEDIFRALGRADSLWIRYKDVIERYRLYLHDIRAFNGTIRNFIKFILSKLKENSAENYAAALYSFYNDDRLAEKLIVNPLRGGDCYTVFDQYNLSYVPRELPDGHIAICQEHVTDSLQALMKADYMLALNSGFNVRRCLICGRHFLVKGGTHTLYCEGACPHYPKFTCRQFGSVERQKELAQNIPKVKAKQTAFSRITKDMQRRLITPEDARKAKDCVRDRLYDALRQSDVSVDEFADSVTSEKVYAFCMIERKSKPRGRPPKGGDAS